MTNDNPNAAEGLRILARHGLDIEALVLSRKADQSETLSDALREATEALGVEVPLGEGDVGISRFVAKLKEIGYTDALTIEREVSPPEQVEDMKAGKALLEQLRG